MRRARAIFRSKIASAERPPRGRAGGAEEFLWYPLSNIRVTRVKDASGTVIKRVGTLHLDGLGSVRAVTDETGLARERTAFRPYGEEIAALTPLTLPETKGYIGERYDDAAGLQYLDARYYNPRLAMFIQPDWWEVTQAGVGTNRYSYSFGDPVNGRDPSGHAAIYKDGKYKGQVNPGEPGYKEITCGCGGSSMMPSDWVRFNQFRNNYLSGAMSQKIVDKLGNLRTLTWNEIARNLHIGNPEFVNANPALSKFVDSSSFYAATLVLLEKSNYLAQDLSKIHEVAAWISISKSGVFSMEIRVSTKATYNYFPSSGLGPRPSFSLGGIMATMHTHPIDGLLVPSANPESLTGYGVGVANPSDEDIQLANKLGLPGFTVSSKGTICGYDGSGYGGKC